MTKLISTFTAVVLAIATVAFAAPGQGAMGKAAKEAQAKGEKPAKGDRTYTAKRAKDYRKGDAKYQKHATKRDIQPNRRDLKADEKELKRLRGDLKRAQKAGDWRRAERDRAAISRLEYEIRAERDHIRRNQPDAKRYGKPVPRSWWARHLGRNGA
jgi:hypothetical protein